MTRKKQRESRANIARAEQAECAIILAACVAGCVLLAILGWIIGG